MAERAGAQGPVVLNVGPGFLTKNEIEAHWRDLFPTSEEDLPPPVRDVNPASVDLHLGSEYFVTKADRPGKLSDESPYMIIPHGEFALLTTWEVVNVPVDTLALISMRNRFKEKGLINVSGFHLDPGFRGQIFYSVYNAGPSDFTLRLHEPTFTIFFSTLVQPTNGYEGKYQGQTGVVNMAERASTLKGPPVNLVQLDQRLRDLEIQQKIYGAIGLAILGAAATVVLVEVL